MLALASLVVACSEYPRDAAGTLDRVRGSHLVRVGIVAMPHDRDQPNEIATYLSKVSAETGARPEIRQGASETLLAELERGELDLVLGEYADGSPWETDVSILKPLSERKAGAHRIGVSPVARNGENAWIMLLERLARNGTGK